MNDTIVYRVLSEIEKDPYFVRELLHAIALQKGEKSLREEVVQQWPEIAVRNHGMAMLLANAFADGDILTIREVAASALEDANDHGVAALLRPKTNEH
jgi:hypothetical protein